MKTSTTTTSTFTKIISIFVIIFLLVIIYGFIFIIEFAIVFTLTLNFYADNIATIGSYIFTIISLVLMAERTNHVRKNLQKRNWKVVKTDSIAYEIQENYPNTPALMNIKFTFYYKLLQRTKTKIFSLALSKLKLEDTRTVLNTKIQQQNLKAILYTNPSKEHKIIYQNEFTITNALQMPMILFLELLLLKYSADLSYLSKHNLNYNSAGKYILSSENITKTISFLRQSSLFYVIILNILLIVTYLILLLIGYTQSGIKSYRNYPMFIEEGKEESIDLIRGLRKMVELCPQCGDIIELKETYCANCGLKTNIET